MAADVEINIKMFDELVGKEISLRIEIGWTERRSPVDAQIDGSLNRVATKKSTVFVIKYSEVPFAVARKSKDFEIPIRALAKVLSSSKGQFDRLSLSQIL